MLTYFFVLAFPFIRLANYFLLQPLEAFRAYRGSRTTWSLFDFIFYPFKLTLLSMHKSSNLFANWTQQLKLIHRHLQFNLQYEEKGCTLHLRTPCLFIFTTVYSLAHSLFHISLMNKRSFVDFAQFYHTKKVNLSLSRFTPWVTKNIFYSLELLFVGALSGILFCL